MSEIELLARKGKHDPLTPVREHARLSPGAYFAEHKALVDARRAPLARLGMDARHVEALRMPPSEDKPLEVLGQPAIAVPIEATKVEDQTLGEFTPKKLPSEIEEAL